MFEDDSYTRPDCPQMCEHPVGSVVEEDVESVTLRGPLPRPLLWLEQLLSPRGRCASPDKRGNPPDGGMADGRAGQSPAAPAGRAPAGLPATAPRSSWASSPTPRIVHLAPGLATADSLLTPSAPATTLRGAHHQDSHQRTNPVQTALGAPPTTSRRIRPRSYFRSATRLTISRSRSVPPRVSRSWWR